MYKWTKTLFLERYVGLIIFFCSFMKNAVVTIYWFFKRQYARTANKSFCKLWNIKQSDWKQIFSFYVNPKNSFQICICTNNEIPLTRPQINSNHHKVYIYLALNKSKQGNHNAMGVLWSDYICRLRAKKCCGNPDQTWRRQKKKKGCDRRLQGIHFS